MEAVDDGLVLLDPLHSMLYILKQHLNSGVVAATLRLTVNRLTQRCAENEGVNQGESMCLRDKCLRLFYNGLQHRRTILSSDHARTLSKCFVHRVATASSIVGKEPCRPWRLDQLMTVFSLEAGRESFSLTLFLR